MLTWIKRLFGVVPKKTPLVLTNPIKYEDEVKVTKRPPKPAPTKPKSKKAKAKKFKAVDLGSMTKSQLLSEAKKRRVKANASLSKGEILKRIKNG